jgi:hypothetical protein
LGLVNFYLWSPCIVYLILLCGYVISILNSWLNLQTIRKIDQLHCDLYFLFSCYRRRVGWSIAYNFGSSKHGSCWVSILNSWLNLQTLRKIDQLRCDLYFLFSCYRRRMGWSIAYNFGSLKHGSCWVKLQTFFKTSN